MTVDEVREALLHRNLHKAAEATGIKYNTIWRIAHGKVKNPSYENITALIEYIKQY